jgi:hypothetical protein
MAAHLQTKGRSVLSMNCSRLERRVMRDVGIFGCGEDEHCVEDSVSSLGGRCINLDVEHEQDFDETLAVESHRRLAGIPCTYLDGITEGVKCEGFNACYKTNGNAMINVTDVGCGSCNSYKAATPFRVIERSL